MRIEKNKEKLRRWLTAEESKLTKINGRLIPKNQLRSVLNKISAHTFLIKESKKRFTPLTSKVKFNTIWKNNNSSNWNENFNGLAKAVPLILVRNNGRYLGHVWVNGVKVPNRPTGHFQGIQKTVNLNNNLVKAMKSNNLIRNRVKVTPYLMKAAENHLRNLGYRSMSTYWPMGKMLTMLNKSPNWKETSNLVFKKNIV